VFVEVVCEKGDNGGIKGGFLSVEERVRDLTRYKSAVESKRGI
jgi:hypothetical protein